MKKQATIQEAEKQECTYCYKKTEDNYKGYCSKMCFYKDMGTL